MSLSSLPPSPSFYQQPLLSSKEVHENSRAKFAKSDACSATAERALRPSLAGEKARLLCSPSLPPSLPHSLPLLAGGFERAAKLACILSAILVTRILSFVERVCGKKGKRLIVLLITAFAIARVKTRCRQPCYDQCRGCRKRCLCDRRQR